MVVGHRVVGANRTGLAHAPAFDHGRTGHLLPFLGRGFGGGHAACLRHRQRREVKRAEIGVVQQAIEQRVDGGQQMEWAFLQRLYKPGDIARVGNEGHVGTPAHAQQTEGQRKDVIQRQRCNAVALANIAHLDQRRREPGFGLQHPGDDVAVGDHRSLGQASRAAGVLKEGRGIARGRAGGERFAPALRQRSGEANNGSLPGGTIERQLVGRNHFGQVAHGKRDPLPLEAAQQIAQPGQHHMAHLGLVDHLLQHMGKILENDNGLGARVPQLVLKLTGRVQGVDIDHREPGPQHRGHGHQELRHIGHHDGHSVTRAQTLTLQPCPQSPAVAVQLAIGHPGFHADRHRACGVFSEAVFNQLGQRGVHIGVDVVRHTRRVLRQPGAIGIGGRGHGLVSLRFCSVMGSATFAAPWRCASQNSIQPSVALHRG